MGLKQGSRLKRAVWPWLLAHAALASGVVGESPYALRFRGVSALYGSDALERFRSSHVAVIGMGGVGSWAAEAIARTGFGTITLVDLDEVCISNTNRQLHSLESTIGQPKVEVIERRCREINPECDVRAVACWVTAANVDEFLASASPAFSAVIDAVDGVGDKTALIDACVRTDVPIVTVGAAGGRTDPTAVRSLDLAFVHGDSLLQKVRRELRLSRGYPADVKGRGYRASGWGVTAISSPEVTAPRQRRGEGEALAPSCDTFGTAAHLTGTFGFAAAAVVASCLADERGAGGEAYGDYARLRQRCCHAPCDPGDDGLD